MWWGTTDMALIASHIYDRKNNMSVGHALYMPILTAPVPDAGRKP
jgi:hypothetical protein